MYPSYLESYKNGRLNKIVDEAFKMLESCCICPRRCKVNRLKDEEGFCQTGFKPKVYSLMPHYGEEPAISGKLGSGTIFFSSCNMNCVYCQNYEFSQSDKGRQVGFEELADCMLRLQDFGCHNINLVTPTHIMPQILKALNNAIFKGLKIPIVYNTGGYEFSEVIKLLDGIVDIYLPDMRYSDSAMAVKYSNAKDYPKYNQETLKEMYRQVGNAEIDSNGLIKRGLIIRHLVLPNNIAGTDKIMEFISKELSKDTYISLMSQYAPCHNAEQFKELSRRVTSSEYEEAQQAMQKYGLNKGWIQESGGLDRFAGINIKPLFKDE
ncbi:MAG: radical SAM protein [Candidatus Omnitrophica bacterium]|nr:radical SAM protein [Candidatus Omnitrophota bacterium]